MDADADDECPRFGGGSAADEDAAAVDEDAAAVDEDAAAADSHFDGLSFARNSSREDGASQQWNER